MSLLRIRAGYFLSGIGFGAGIALLQLRADLAASTELLSTQVRRERERERAGKRVFFDVARETVFFFNRRRAAPSRRFFAFLLLYCTRPCASLSLCLPLVLCGGHQDQLETKQNRSKL